MSLHLLSPPRPQAVAFDVVGTLFSLEALRAALLEQGLPGDLLEAWFAAGLRDAFALAATGRFEPFESVLDGALAQVCAQRRLEADSTTRQQVLSGLKELGPFPDARRALALLGEANIQIVAVSNGSRSATRHLLDKAGIASAVERIVSVEDVQRFKPAAEVYEHTAEALNLQPKRMALIAAHPWDIHGAKQAGFMAGYVARGVPFPSAVFRKPDLEGDSLVDVAERIAALTP